MAASSRYMMVNDIQRETSAVSRPERGGARSCFRMGCDEANALLDARLRKVAFRRYMDTLLRPGLPKFDVDKGAEIVRKAYFMHLKL